MNRLTDVVKNLIIINAIIFVVVGYGLLPIPDLRSHFVLFPFGSQMFEYYQIVTSMFMHADPRHLLFNMLALFFLGPIVESTLGPKRFLTLYLTAGIVSSFAHLAFSAGSAVGASGAINGVVVAFAVMFPNMKLMIFPLPFEVKAKYLVGAYIAYDLFSGLGGLNTGIAHFAHLGGALVGFLMIKYWGLENRY